MEHLAASQSCALYKRPAGRIALPGWILDANYFHRDVALAESAIRKLERHRGIGTEGGQISEPSSEPSYSNGREIA